MVFKRRFIYLGIINFLLFFIVLQVFCYDNLIIHPKLTRAAITIYNKQEENKITEEQAIWIEQGAIAEDADPRYLNHFYNPKTGEGLNDGFFKGISAKEWAKHQNSATGDYSESAILKNYKDKNLKRAYQGIGHILHLIQDMDVPAHVRNDAHPEGDPYEEWAKKYGNVNLNKANFIKINNLDQAFDELANYSYDNFFSQDTIDNFLLNKIQYFQIEKDIEGKNVQYGYYLDYRLIKVIKGTIHNEYFFDFKVHLDYWNMLSPKAVGYSAGVIDYFMKEFKKIDNEQKREKVSFLDKIKDDFLSYLNNFKYIFGDTVIASRKAINSIFNFSSDNVKITQQNLQFFTEANKEIIEDIIIKSAEIANDIGGKVLSASEKSISYEDILKAEKVSAEEKFNLNNNINEQNNNKEQSEAQEAIKNNNLENSESKELEVEFLEKEVDSILKNIIVQPNTPFFPISAGDNIAPEIEIINTPPNPYSSTSANFIFRANEEVNYQYNLDNSGWRACKSNKIFTDLSEGIHKVEIRAADARDNISKILSYSWLIDITAPSVLLNSLENYYSSDEFLVSWSGEDIASGSSTISSGLENYDIQYKINEDDWRDWIMATTSEKAIFNIGAEAGDNIFFRVCARDKAGNIGEWSDKIQTIISFSTADHIVISEFVTRGLTGSYDEFVELYNPTNYDINLSQWKLQTKPAESENWTNRTGSLGLPENIIFAHKYYLISAKDYDFNIFPDYRHPSNWGLADTGGHIRIINNEEIEIDKVGYGNAQDPEGNASQADLSGSESLERKANILSDSDSMINGIDLWRGNGYDSNNNNNDFIIRNIPDPQNSFSFFEPRENTPIIPENITDLYISSTTVNSIKLSWTSSENFNIADGAYYDLRYEIKNKDCKLQENWNSANQIDAKILPAPPDYSGEIQEAEIKDLLLGVEYCFAIKTYNGENWSELSNEAEVLIISEVNSILIDNISSINIQFTNELIWPHTIFGEDRILVVPIYWKDYNKMIINVNFADIDLVQAVIEDNHSAGVNNAIFYLINPPLGNYNIDIKFTASMEAGASAISLNNINIDNFLGEVYSRYAQSEHAENSINILKNNAVIIDAISFNASQGILSADEGQIEFFNDTLGGCCREYLGSSYKITNSAGEYKMGWLYTNNNVWSHSIIVINGK